MIRVLVVDDSAFVRRALSRILNSDPEIMVLDTARDGRGLGGVIAHPYLYEFDLASETCKETKFSDSAAEFPRIDDRLVGRKNRWGYAATAEPAEGAAGVFRRITKYDREGSRSVHRPQVAGISCGVLLCSIVKSGRVFNRSLACRRVKIQPKRK